MVKEPRRFEHAGCPKTFPAPETGCASASVALVQFRRGGRAGIARGRTGWRSRGSAGAPRGGRCSPVRSATRSSGTISRSTASARRSSAGCSSLRRSRGVAALGLRGVRVRVPGAAARQPGVRAHRRPPWAQGRTDDLGRHDGTVDGRDRAPAAHAAIGVAAPVLLVACRLLQGLSVGGEFTTSITLLGEGSPPGRRGLLCALPSCTVGVGQVLGSLAVLPRAGGCCRPTRSRPGAGASRSCSASCSASRPCGCERPPLR